MGGVEAIDFKWYKKLGARMNLLDNFYRSFDTLTNKIGPRIPFTGSHIIRKRLSGSGSLLDVGCGAGVTMANLNRDKHFNYVIGVDIHRPYLNSCKMNNTHNDIVQADIRHLPFMPQSFDYVIGLEVLEHLEKEDGYELLKSLQHIAKKGVVLALPAGHYGQHAYDSNLFQEHRSQWTPQEMKNLGFKVNVSSIRGLGGEWRGRGNGIWLLLDISYRLFSVAITPLVTIMPIFAGHMVCYKRIASAD